MKVAILFLMTFGLSFNNYAQQTEDSIPAGWWKIPKTNARITIGGYVKFDMIHDFNPINSPSFFDVSKIPTDGSKGTNTHLQANETRLILDFRTPMGKSMAVTTARRRRTAGRSSSRPRSRRWSARRSSGRWRRPAATAARPRVSWASVSGPCSTRCAGCPSTERGTRRHLRFAASLCSPGRPASALKSLPSHDFISGMSPAFDCRRSVGSITERRRGREAPWAVERDSR